MNAVGVSLRAVPFIRAVLLALLFACGGEVTVPVSRTLVLQKGAGDHQAAEVGTNLAQPLVVEVRDALGIPSKGIKVIFRSNARGARTVEAQSDSLGRAWATWQLGELAGPQLIRASLGVPNNSGEVFFEALALVGPPAAVVVVAGLDLLAAPGTELDPLDVLLTDRFSNPAANAALRWTIEAGGGTIRAFNERTDSRGRAQAVWTLGASTDLQTVIVAAGNTTRRIRANIGPIFSAVQVVSGSDHSCALTDDGVAHCWGSNSAGQLGIGGQDWDPHRLPSVVQTSVRFKSLTAGMSHTCGLALDGSTWCWGDNRAQQVGSVNTDFATNPARVTAAPTFVVLAAGGFHTCGLTSAGVAHCWGDDSFGQLGRGSDRSKAEFVFGFGHNLPKPVAGSFTFSSIAASYWATCGVTTTGSSYCWGNNEQRILGSEASQRCHLASRLEYDYDSVYFTHHECSSSPVPVPTPTSVASLAMDQNGVCARLTSSQVMCWGRSRTELAVIPSARVSTLWISEYDVCGLMNDGTVSCWTPYPPFPSSNPLGGRTLVDINSSGRHTCGLTKPPGSEVYCWGTNYSGEIGDGTTNHRIFPVAVVSPYPGSR